MNEESSIPQIESVKRFYEAINRFDLAACVQDFDPEIERVEPPDFPSGGTCRGIEAVKSHIAQGRGRWEEGTCKPTRLIVAGNNVIAACHVHVRLKGKANFNEGDLADVFTFRDGRIIAYRSFARLSEALRWASAH